MNLKKALDQLEDFVTAAHANIGVDKPPSDSFPEVFFFRGELGGLMLWGEEARAYAGCMYRIYSLVEKQGRLSQKAVEALVQSAILEALDVNNRKAELDFQSRLAEARRALEGALWAEPETCEVHLQVLGIDPDGLPCTIGDTEIYAADSSRQEYLKARTAKIIAGYEASETVKDTLRDIAYRDIDQFMGGRTFARIKVDAIDAVAAHALAVRQLRLLVDFINFYVDLLPTGGKCAYLPGEKTARPTLSLLFREGEKPRHAHQVTAWGPVGNIRLSELASERASRVGFPRASQLVSRPNRSGLEERLLSAIQWAGRATANERREEAFLMFAIALEALLLGNREQGALGSQLSIRGAHLLGQDRAVRGQVRKQLRDLYRRRSGIVHSGSIEVPDTEFQQIRFLTKQAVVTVLATEPFSRMSSEKELEQWFETQVLAGGG